MRKSLIAGLLGLALFGAAISGQAADNLTYSLVVTITVPGINIVGPANDGDYLDQGGLRAGESKLSVNYAFINSGETTIDLSLNTVNVGPFNGWSNLATGIPASSVPGNDQYRVSAMFTQWNRVPAPSEADFQANDVLTSTQTLCSGTQFALDGEAAGLKGFNMPSASVRDLMFLIELGPMVSGQAKTIAPSVKITASSHI